MAKKKRLCIKYPYVYGVICTAYMHLENNPFNWGVVYSIFCSSLGAFIVYLSFEKQIVYSTIAAVIGLALPFVCFKPLLNKLITFFNCTGIKDEDGCIFSGKYFILKGNGEPCELNIKAIKGDRFEFVNEQTLKTCAVLNAKAYQDTNWKGSIDQKYKRNSSHYYRNNKCLMLLKTHEGIARGFTHIFPVSKNAWDLYMKAGINDNDFPASQICANDLPSNPDIAEDIPFGLIIFSVASVGNRDFKNSINPKKDLGDFLEQAIVFHLKKLCDIHFPGNKGRRIPVLLQNMDKCYLKFFESCAISTDKLSKDKVRIIAFEITNIDFEKDHSAI